MPQDWVSGYKRHDITGCTGPNTYISGVPWRLVLHTTESGAGSMAGLLTFFSNNPCSTPHFAIDPSTGEKYQFIPLNWSAAALRGGRNGYQTNKAKCIQVEIIGRAAETHTWPDSWLKFVGDFIADVVKAGVPLNLNNFPGFVGQMDGFIARENAPQRFTPDAWHAFDGVCGHQHVPFQDHWDPGKINIVKVLNYAKASVGNGGTVTPPTTNTEEEELMTVLDDVRQEFVNQDTRMKQYMDLELKKRLEAILMNVDPVGVAAGNPGQGPAFLRTDVEAILAILGQSPTAVSLDPAALAASIATALGNDLAKKLVDELQLRLKN